MILTYVTEIGPAEFDRECRIDPDYSENGELYQTSPDGWFSIKLNNMEKINMDIVDGIKIEFSGNNVPKN